MQALQNPRAAQNACVTPRTPRMGGAGVAEVRSSEMSVHGSTWRIRAAGVGRSRLGSRSDRLRGCTATGRPRTVVSKSVESRAVSVKASTTTGESSDWSPGDSLVERAGELAVGSADGVSQTGAETSEFHVDRSLIPGRHCFCFLFFGPHDHRRVCS